MEFGKLTNRIVLMQASGTTRNHLGELVPSYTVYHPGLPELKVSAVEKDGVTSYFPIDYDGTDTYNIENTPYAYNASVIPASGNEYTEFQKLRVELTYNITMRYVPKITHEMFIFFDNKKLNIEHAIDVDSKHKELKIYASEIER